MVPTLIVGDRHVVGFDAGALAEVLRADAGQSADRAADGGSEGGPAADGAARPPGNSLEADQGHRVIPSGATLAEDLRSLLGRIDSELDYNAAKGSTPFRQGMHDGLRFAQDAVADLLSRHGHAATVEPREWDF